MFLNLTILSFHIYLNLTAFWRHLCFFWGTGHSSIKSNGFLLKELKHKKGSMNPRKKTKFVQAVAIPVSPSAADSAEYRKKLAESYGFRQIGEPLPDSVTLKSVIDSLPKKVTLICY